MYNIDTMQTKNNFLIRIRNFFIPPTKASWDDFKEVLPFFVLMTLALSWMFIVFVQQVEGPYLKALFTVLMLIHLGVYWGIFNFHGTRGGLSAYFILQGVLAIILVLVARDEGLVIGLFGSVIGNTVGILQKPRTIFLVVVTYLIIALLSILYLTGSNVMVSMAGVAIPAILLSAFIAYMFRRQLEAREKTQKLLEDLQEAHAKLEAYTEQVEELTLAQERQRIARELHDTLAQELTGMVLQLEAVSTHINSQNNERAQEILQQAMSQSRFTLAEARKVIDGLRTERLESSSMEEAINREAARFTGTSGVPCEVMVRISAPPEADVQTELLKVVSEGLSNISRHASADQAWLRLMENEGGLVLEIEDNGRGFEPQTQAGKPGHYGLVGIEERAGLLGGRVEIDSQPEGGTCLRVTIPLKEPA